MMPQKSPRPILLILLLALVSLVGYALRSNIAIAQEYMAPELGLSMNDMGTITAWGFQLAYAVFQIPAGILGDRYGARRVLGLALLTWVIATLGSALVSGTGAAFAALFGIRFLLGAGQAATYPVGAMAIAQAVPPTRRATANAFFISSALLGAALAPLTLAPLMVAVGWRAVFLTSAGLGLVTACLWFLLIPAPPRRLGTNGVVPSMGAQVRASLALLRNRNLLLLSTGYLLHAATFFVFIFWFFRYLTEGRGFSVLASGFWGSVPALTAFCLAPLGGLLADRLGRGPAGVRARLRVAVGSLLAAALLVLIGANLTQPLPAIAALALSVACLNATEGPVWATATALGAASPGAAGGILNFMGNLGGIISIWAVPRMKDAWGWTTMLGIWAGVAVVAALLWSLVRTETAGSQPHVGQPVSPA